MKQCVDPLKGANLSTVSYQISLDFNVLSADIPDFFFLAYYDVNGKVCFKKLHIFIFIFTDVYYFLSSCRTVAPSSLARCSRSAIPALTPTTVVVRLNPMVASIISPTLPDGAKTKKVLISSWKRSQYFVGHFNVPVHSFFYLAFLMGFKS